MNKIILLGNMTREPKTTSQKGKSKERQEIRGYS